MKRSIAFILALMMVITLVLTGCGGSSADQPAASAAENNGAAPAAENAPAAETAATEPGEPAYGGDAAFYYSDFNDAD